MSVSCFCCNQTFEDYQALALHISQAKKGHRKSKKWAAKYNLKVGLLNQKKDIPERIPFTDEDKQNKLSTIRTVSGEVETVVTVCPQCKGRSHQQLPIEFTRSQYAWRTVQGTLRVSCPNCTSTRRANGYG
jgi:hypothetical protein